MELIQLSRLLLEGMTELLIGLCQHLIVVLDREVVLFETCHLGAQTLDFTLEFLEVSLHFLLVIFGESVFETSDLVDLVEVEALRFEDTDRFALRAFPDFLVQGGFFAMFKIGEHLGFELNFRLFDQEL